MMTMRQGLPRVRGGEPWPPQNAQVTAEQDSQASPAPPPSVTLRRGLPRTRGGEPWPPVGQTQTEGSQPAAIPKDVPTYAPAEPACAAQSAPTENAPAENAPAKEQVPTGPVSEDSGARRLGRFSLTQWIGGGVTAAIGLIVVLSMVVMSARYILLTEWGSGFIARFNGHSTMVEGAPEGFPIWLNLLHYFNAFLIIFIIRSGLHVRRERRPEAYWTPRSGGKKISLMLWFHQSLDILWILSGVIFFVLLFATGQWIRIVPTSWDVFPNALSAALQYLTLDWPVENGWVHYNALQLLTYFITVFIAAPLAIASGVRMSDVWNEKWVGLSKAFPASVARTVHVCVMVYFVAFIIVHVVLVFATGALRNLNHMYAAQGSPDPSAYANNWTGFILFAVSTLVIVAVWFVARPVTLAGVAKNFGDVTAR